MKALVIEDTLTSAMLVCNQLRKMGIEPVLARDGSSGIELFKQHRPELVLLDVVMPDMDGYEVAKRLRQLESDGEWTPIIFLTARTSDEDLERGIAVGGDDYLVKPVSNVVLAAKVRAMQRIAQMRHSLVVLTRRLDEANRDLVRLSAVDGLTGISNRRQFDEYLAREWGRAQRHGAPLSLLFADVDHFKQYNDMYGHQAGDDCLREVAQSLRSQVKRPTDLVARYGGEEFAAILPDTPLEGALRLAEGMRKAILDCAIPRGDDGEIVTVSIGVASASPQRAGEGSDTLLRQADQALYGAKAAGRNRVTTSDEVLQA